MDNEQLFAVRDTGQIVVEGDRLRIGVGNIEVEPAVEGNDNAPDKITTGLWLFFRDHPEWDCQIRLGEGETKEVQGYMIHVISINLDDDMVMIGVVPPRESMNK